MKKWKNTESAQLWLCHIAQLRENLARNHVYTTMEAIEGKLEVWLAIFHFEDICLSFIWFRVFESNRHWPAQPVPPICAWVMNYCKSMASVDAMYSVQWTLYTVHSTPCCTKCPHNLQIYRHWLNVGQMSAIIGLNFCEQVKYAQSGRHRNGQFFLKVLNWRP